MPQLTPLRRELIADVLRGAPELGVLETLGDPAPARAASALVRAAAHPDLAPERDEWLPALLETARPGSGAEALADLADRARRELGRPLSRGPLPNLARVLGSSPSLARVLARSPDWERELGGNPPTAPDTRRPELSWSAIRAAKYRGLLRVAARDLADRPFHESLRELSDLADACLDAALECAARERRIAAPALFALGKLGGRELNFSSDVDLLFLYERASGEDEMRRQRAVSELVQSLKSCLEERTDAGFIYRVDLDLRPEGRNGTLSNPVRAALDYYESFGADWERQMLIRLRPVAGDRRAAETFTREIAPFVYRRHIDPSAVAAVRKMKTRIESERRRGGVDLDLDLKEGPGGIRDVEFLVQALQLLLGGERAALRTGNVLDALSALGSARALDDGVVATLSDAYRWLRRAEHALQMVEERQTHRFPTDGQERIELARRMAYRDDEAHRARDRLVDDWTNVRAEVRGHFEALVLSERGT